MKDATPPPPDYLRPYTKAAAIHGGGFSSLLWASPETQAARFTAFAEAAPFKNSTVLDVGCGRGDLLDFLIQREETPQEYIGIEGVPELAAAAERVRPPAGPTLRIVRGDFVADPRLLFTASDLIVLSGSLNTAKDVAFFETVRRCYDATAHRFLFNFLSSSYLAGASHLYWRDPGQVEKFCRGICPRVRRIDGYLQGDTTFLLEK